MEAPPAPSGERDGGTATPSWDYPWETSGLRDAVGLDR